MTRDETIEKIAARMWDGPTAGGIVPWSVLVAIATTKARQNVAEYRKEAAYIYDLVFVTGDSKPKQMRWTAPNETAQAVYDHYMTGDTTGYLYDAVQQGRLNVHKPVRSQDRRYAAWMAGRHLQEQEDASKKAGANPIGDDGRYPSTFYSEDREQRIRCAHYRTADGPDDVVTVGMLLENKPGGLWAEIALPPQEAEQFGRHMLRHAASAGRVATDSEKTTND